MIKNTGSQKIGAQMVSATDGSAFTGTVTVYVTGDAGTQAIGSVGSGICTHEGNGYHTYAPSQAETNYTLIAFTFIGTGAVPQTVQVFTVGYDPTAAVVPANVTQLLGTAWLTPGTAGTPDVNVKLISDDATAANNAESFFDGTGYAGTNNVIPTVTTLTNLPAITANWLTATGTASDFGTEIGTAVWATTTRLLTAGTNIDGSTFTAIPWNASWDAEVQSEVQDAIEVNHLDHLLAVTYDPASKPGAADALLNEIVGNDGGVAQFAANALELAPTGGSAPTAAAIADAVWDEAQADHVSAGTFGITASEIADILVDTAEIGAAGAGLTALASQTSVNDLPTNAELATALGAADDAVLAAIAALNNLSAAQVNAEIVDALATDTYAEPGQGAPAATTSITAKLNYLYKAWRNKKTQTSTTFSLFADDTTTVDQKGTNSDDGTTTTIGEIATGP